MSAVSLSTAVPTAVPAGVPATAPGPDAGTSGGGAFDDLVAALLAPLVPVPSVPVADPAPGLATALEAAPVAGASAEDAVVVLPASSSVPAALPGIPGLSVPLAAVTAVQDEAGQPVDEPATDQPVPVPDAGAAAVLAAVAVLGAVPTPVPVPVAGDPVPVVEATTTRDAGQALVGPLPVPPTPEPTAPTPPPAVADSLADPAAVAAEPEPDPSEPAAGTADASDTSASPPVASTQTPVPPLAVPTAAPVQSPQPGTPEVRAATQHVLDEVVRLIDAPGAATAKQVVLRLDPGTLGEVHVRLRVHDGVVRVQLTAGDEAVRSALGSDATRLHQLLGVRADDVRVVVQDPHGVRDPGTGREPAPGGGPHGSSDQGRPGQQPGQAPAEHGRPTWTSDVTRATDGTRSRTQGSPTTNPRTASPDRLDVSV